MEDLSIDDLARRYLTGESTKDLGKVTGIHSSTIRNRLIRHGVTIRSQSESVRLAAGKVIDMDEVVRRYLAGKSAQSLAKAFNVSTGLIQDRLAERGIEIRSRAAATRLANEKPVDTAEVIRRYQAGETLQTIADSFGVSVTPIRSALITSGTPIRSDAGRTVNRLVLDTDGLVQRYAAGESELAIAKATVISRPAIRRRLIEAGVTLRGGSEANDLRFARMTPEDRLALAEAAHAAVRGVPQSEEHRSKIAMTNQARIHPSHTGPNEKTLAEWLRCAGLEVVPQMACGRYNIDIAVAESRIAVEVFSGHWHAGGDHANRFRERFDYLLDWGWLPVIVWITSTWHLTMAATDYIVTLHERLCAGEPRGSQEHVIRGDGDLGPIGKSNPLSGAVIMGHNPGNPSRGEDGRYR